MMKDGRRIIIEKWGASGHYGILFPNGRVMEVQSKKAAERHATKYFARGIKPNEKRIDFIEWRDLTGREDNFEAVRTGEKSKLGR